MRKLTITRHKCFIGCAMKDKVYIRDALTPETIIDGVPCRKIGEIRNGETKTFSIDEDQQQIFLIVDKISKDYCNATVTIPEGQEDVTLSGKHYFVFGSNPFRFDGEVLSKEQRAKRSRNHGIGVVITLVALIIGLNLGIALSNLVFSAVPATPQTFAEGELQITLTDAFKQVEQPGFFACYQSKDTMVLAVREEQSYFGKITLNEYCELVMRANYKWGMEMHREQGFVWFEYTDAPEGQEFYYFAACYRGGDAFWVINFATPVKYRDTYKETFLDWAKQVKFVQGA